MKTFLLIILTASLILASRAQCPFEASQTIFGRCKKDITIHSSSPMDQAAIYKDNVLIDTIPYIIHGGELILGGHGAGAAANQFNNPDGIFVDTDLAIYELQADGDGIERL
jgi:hypothetical protein